jgi:hypothetical protein
VSHALQSPFPALATADALNARVRAGFVLANGAKSAHPCSMNEDVRKYATAQGINEDEALKKGMATKSKEFVEKSAEDWAKA